MVFVPLVSDPESFPFIPPVAAEKSRYIVVLNCFQIIRGHDATGKATGHSPINKQIRIGIMFIGQVCGHAQGISFQQLVCGKDRPTRDKLYHQSTKQVMKQKYTYPQRTTNGISQQRKQQLKTLKTDQYESRSKKGSS